MRIEIVDPAIPATLTLWDMYQTSDPHWVFEDLEDWWGQTADKINVTERPQSHGAFGVSRSRRVSRAITVKAHVLGNVDWDALSGFDDISRYGAEHPVTVTVFPDGPDAFPTSRVCTVESIQAADNIQQPSGTVVVHLVARDPRRYAAAGFESSMCTRADDGSTHSDGITWPVTWPARWIRDTSALDPNIIKLTNFGTAPSEPRFTVEGGVSGAVITCVETGKKLGIDWALNDTQILEIDARTRRATIEGQDITPFMTSREWESIPAGETRSYLFEPADPSGTPQLCGYLRGAWW